MSFLSAHVQFLITFAILLNISTTQLINAQPDAFNFAPLAHVQFPDCGKVDEIEGELRTKIPWTAAIFLRGGSKSSVFKFYINGIILSPTKILSVAGGIYGSLPPGTNGKYQIARPENYKVAVGLSSSSLFDADRNTQIVQVSHIVPFTKHEDTNREFHFFIYHLKAELNLKTPYARAACVIKPPRNRNNLNDIPAFQIQSPSIFGGYGLPGDTMELKQTSVKFLTQKECRKAFKYYYKGNESNHLSCGRTVPTNGSEVQKRNSCLLHGSAVLFPILKNQWYLNSITALIPSRKRGRCNENSLYFFGRIWPALEWIEKNLECQVGEFPCINGSCIPISKVCNSIDDCSDGSDEDRRYCEIVEDHCPKFGYNAKKFRCGIGGKCVEEALICDETDDCGNGADESVESCNYSYLKKTFEPDEQFAGRPQEFIDENIKNLLDSQKKGIDDNFAQTNSTCKVIRETEGVISECTFEKEEGPVENSTVRIVPIDCDAPLVSTKIKLRCGNFYRSKSKEFSIERTCGGDLTWNPIKQFSCEFECGVVVKGPRPGRRHSNGLIIYPWIAAIFVYKQGKYDFVCSASLIERSVLVTAAHCIIQLKMRPERKEFYKVFVGAVSSNFDENVEDSIAKLHAISQVWIPDSYRDDRINSNIGIIQLLEPVVFGEFIRPVCYLLPNTGLPPRVGKTGITLGFISDGNNSLQVGELRSNDYCDDEKVSDDTNFCAEWVKTPRRLDVLGSGMYLSYMRSSKSIYTLKGIVNKIDSTNRNLENPATFTHVDAFGDWILEILEKIGDS